MNTLHLAPGHWAGHMRIYHRICRSLAEAGHRAELAAHPAEIDHLDPSLPLHSLGPLGPTTLNWRLLQRLQRNQRAFRLALRSDAAMFAFYAPEFVPWGVRLRRLLRRPVIFDCMEDFEGYALQRGGIPTFLRPPIAFATGALLRFAARNVDAVVTSDIGTAELFRPTARRVVVIHNFPRLSLFPDPGTSAQPEFDLTYHGSIPRYHLQTCFAIDDALRARGRLVTWHFIGRMAHEEWFASEVSKRAAQQRFTVTGQVPHDQVAREVARARIGIIPLPDLPKFHSNIPQKLFEFMALRMPVVLSDLPPSRPFSSDGACAFLVRPDAPEEYAEAILRLLENEPLRRSMGAEGRRRMVAEYNWERESEKLIALYEELASRGQEPDYHCR